MIKQKEFFVDDLSGLGSIFDANKFQKRQPTSNLQTQLLSTRWCLEPVENPWRIKKSPEKL
jgi:hypothetical protein